MPDRPDRQPAPEQPENDGADARFPIVGIGASAGGLEAFERLFRNLPADSGMAFVLVQHLDPTHHSMLSELVGRFTRMPVHEVADGTTVAPNHVYVIPPNTDLALHHGRLHLLEPTARRGMRLPIDHFFRSLARDRRELAAGIVLSGTGTDGTLGARDIKGEGGLVMVQEPSSAAYDGMPASAEASGAADFVLPPEKMPEALLHFARSMFPERAWQTHEVPAEPNLVDKVFLLLRSQTGHDFSQYKQATLLRRIERRMVVNRMDGLEEYVTLLRHSPAEADALFKDLLIGVTSFFRDRPAFERLRGEVLPALLDQRRADAPVRIWVPGCATGEEAYSIAILLRELLDERGEAATVVQIFATDIDPAAVETGRAGVYPESIAADVPAELLQRHFTRHGASWQVRKGVREMLVFALQDVTRDPPFSRLDLISCRNLLIYMQPALQRRVLGVFNYVLRPEGWLLLGSSESLGDLTTYFIAVDKKWRLFRSRGPAARTGPAPVTATAPLPGGDRQRGREQPLDLRESVRHHTEQTLLQRFAPVAVTIDDKYNILYVQGRAGPFLEPPTGEGTLNLLRLAREGLRTVLGYAVHRAAAQHSEVRRRNLRVPGEGGERRVHLTVLPVREPAALAGMLTVVLEDAGPYPPARGTAPASGASEDRSATLEQELRETRESLQSSVEQLETSNEELTATNEELQSANEELQSTNEELETSQEELRSVNEELSTVNTELQTKVEELDKTSNDLANLMVSAELPILFLDADIKVQRFTPAATQLLHLLDSDVGRPLEHTTTEFAYDRLVADARELLDTLRPVEKEIQTRSGRWYLLRMRPYRTSDNVIDGVVVTFLDIHAQKRGEELRTLTSAIEQSPASVIITDRQGTIEYVNPRFTEVTGYAREEVRGATPAILKSGEHPPAFFRQLWQTLAGGATWRGELRNRRKNGELYWDVASISPVRDLDGHVTHYVSVQEDITGRKQMETELRDSEARYRGLVENMSSGVAVYRALDDGDDFLFTELNHAAEAIEGVAREAVVGRRLSEAFPGAADLGLVAALRRVWRSGRGERLPAAWYQDETRSGWRQNSLYKLPSGEVVALYDDVGERIASDAALQRNETALQRYLGIFRVLALWNREALLADEATLCHSMCAILVNEGGYRFAWIGYAEADDEGTVRPIARAGVEDGYLDEVRISWHDDDPFGQGPTGRAIRSGEPAVAKDIAAEPAFAPWRKQASRRGYAASAALPVRSADRIIGALNVYGAVADAFDACELELLGELATSLGCAIEAVRRRPA